MARQVGVEGRGTVRRRAGLRLWLSAGWLALLVLVALLAPWIAPKDPLAQDLFAGRLPPFWMAGADPAFLLGTDSLGRDVLSRIIFGTRIALVVAVVSGVLTCVIGATLGLLAGFWRGWVDVLVSRFIDIWMAFPPVLFSILLIAVIGPGLGSITAIPISSVSSTQMIGRTFGNISRHIVPIRPRPATRAEAT